MVDTDLDEKMAQQYQDIENQYAFINQQLAIRKDKVAQRFQMDLGEALTPYQKAFEQKKSKYDKSFSSTDKPDPDKDPEATHEPKGKARRPPKVKAGGSKKLSDKRKTDRSPQPSTAGIPLAIKPKKKRN